MPEMTKRTGPETKQQRESTAAHASVLARLAALKRMSVKELKVEWEALFASPAPNNSRGYLELRLAWRIQELTLGGLSRETRRTLDLLADEIDGKSDRKAIIADPRNPVAGTRLVREWDGVEHTVTVMKDGFGWQGRKFKSLSAVAKAITGTQWNGYRFFGLRERKQERV
ncbi:DUF2924 domain-containing protein [Pannonibacter indicus]|uniref:DUF2924 domain-containing protein n=1 Tax=Pannonibacter indicus TaxID=466044 RepID=A0A0K6I725_9HYPH|nr:DUF2924 domain-containing protein [Pannonibacter indicus]CUA98901.1 Protein of unknown function (DUF2924) [Pannonibacter indicus]